MVSIGAIEAPWAKDADGNPVKTTYTMRGDILIQEVNTSKDTVYPVVADPKMKKNWSGVNIYFSKSDTRRLGAGGVIAGIALGPFTGGLSAAILGIGGVTLGEMSASGRCLGVRYSWGSLVSRSPERTWFFKCSKYKQL